jgi:predicted nucleic acid-binding protein
VSDLYADSSALAKLLLDETESGVLASFLEADGRTPVSSAVVRVELTRAVRLRNPAAAVELHALLAGLEIVPVSDRVLGVAAQLADAHLRSLDAIHLASAVSVGADEMLVYDRSLAEAATAAGIRPVSPGR